MKQVTFRVISRQCIAKDVHELRLAGDASEIFPGQFVNVAVPNFTLRRPISVADADAEAGVLTLTFKVVGEGTKAMAALSEGTELDILTGLGNGYDLTKAGERPLLLGGGVGTPPLYLAAKELCAAGKEVTVILGFNTADEVFYREAFERLGCRVYIATMDGSLGEKGFVTDVMARLDAQAARLNARMAARTMTDAEAEIATAECESILPAEETAFSAYTYFYACGPKPMLRAVCAAATSDGEVSMEERMGCGFGACMGCSLQTAQGPKRVCKDGPVFAKEDILWQ